MVISRLGIRLDKQAKAKFEKASVLLGHKSLTDYVVSVLNENSTKVIDQYESVIVENDIFDRFINACNKAGKPNHALASAAKFVEEQGFK